MSQDYPNDADGDALRRVAVCGNDMSQPMEIDFHIAAPDEWTANRVAAEAVELGYATDVSFNATELDFEDTNESFLWTCTCTLKMVPKYAALLNCQVMLNQVTQPLGAFVDGWGTFGNQKPA